MRDHAIKQIYFLLVFVKTYYKNGECLAEAVCKLRAIFGRNIVPDESTVRRLIKKFESKFKLLDERALWAGGIHAQFFF